jgi:hypothetical protein
MSESDSVWITGRSAERLLGDASDLAPAHAEASGIRQQVVPGLKPRYHRDDVTTLARQIVRGRPLATAK